MAAKISLFLSLLEMLTGLIKMGFDPSLATLRDESFILLKFTASKVSKHGFVSDPNDSSI